MLADAFGRSKGSSAAERRPACPPAGAHALEVLAGLFATCRQHGQDALSYLADPLRRPPSRDPAADPLPFPM